MKNLLSWHSSYLDHWVNCLDNIPNEWQTETGIFQHFFNNTQCMILKMYEPQQCITSIRHHRTMFLDFWRVKVSLPLALKRSNTCFGLVLGWRFIPFLLYHSREASDEKILPIIENDTGFHSKIVIFWRPIKKIEHIVGLDTNLAMFTLSVPRGTEIIEFEVSGLLRRYN